MILTYALTVAVILLGADNVRLYMADKINRPSKTINLVSMKGSEIGFSNSRPPKNAPRPLPSPKNRSPKSPPKY
jgi:hypothetical protein